MLSLIRFRLNRQSMMPLQQRLDRFDDPTRYSESVGSLIASAGIGLNSLFLRQRLVEVRVEHELEAAHSAREIHDPREKISNQSTNG